MSLTINRRDFFRTSALYAGAVFASQVPFVSKTGFDDTKSKTISPLIKVPAHTRVSPKLLSHVDRVVKDIPEKFIKAFISRGAKIFLARNVEDSYYYLNPEWRVYDRKHPNQPNKPWLEIKKDGTCVDNRNYSNTSAMYWNKKAIILQEWYEYGANNIKTRVNSPVWTRHTVGHELGHVLGSFNNDDYLNPNDRIKYARAKVSNVKEYDEAEAFKIAFELDTARIDPEIRKELEYSWCKRKTLGGYVEAFANLFSTFVGTETKHDASVLLRGFPNSAEYLRKKVFPHFGVEMSITQVRENIFPDYLKNVQVSSLEKRTTDRELLRIITSVDDYRPAIVADAECCGR